ncbi:MAG: serine/threonine protein kinase [Acidobacteria bacterium]|nr:serine/threonine protein kinase [Acidobacteriota bacterium]
MSDIDQTRLAEGPPTGSPSQTAVSTTGSGWLSTSGSIDHGRFAPGAVVDGRYRIIGLLGRGGMGEVYRADDLLLGQAVAIKLLPDALSADPQRLVQFHNEVRTARQVSHPNVCRVYDIGDLLVDGSTPPRHQLYLTMEYVDGEDLSSLLRRIGRLPEDKALDIARQICAGLAAAHAKGVIHRDLKPANIMLDSAGQARLMDFGLATVGAVSEIRAGTPAYMAPEQLSGAGVTIQSDVFALGLVLYELFTGRRGFQAKTLGELVELHQTGAVLPPSALVTGLDPAIERVILRCLRSDPADRPSSALAVAAALPGGDPLAAALAAGETPSPQMVAAAGDHKASMSVGRIAAWMMLGLTSLVATAMLANQLGMYAMVPFDRAPASLIDRARDITRLAGATEAPTDRASGIFVRGETFAWLRAQPDAPGSAAALHAGQPPTVVFWYRSSPQWLVPNGVRVASNDPPAVAPGQTLVVLDLAGRLLSFERLPLQLQATVATTTSSVDWDSFFEAAAIDPSTLTPATPTYSPLAFADARAAWVGTWPGMSSAPLRVEAGSHEGRVVYFRTLGPWNLPDAAVAPARSVEIVSLLALLVAPTLMIAAGLVARSNVKAGRGDRLGARRLAGVALVVPVVGWIFAAHHVPDVDIEQARLFEAIALSLFGAAMLWAFYLAAEPYVRKTWPHILITWSRLLSGRFRDSLVGRDLLLGAACGTAMTALSYLFHLVPGWMAWPPIDPHAPELILGTRELIARFFMVLNNAMSNTMLGVLGLALLRSGLQRLSPRLGTTAVAFSVAALLFAPLAARGQFQSGHIALDLAFGLLLVVIILGVIFRLGLFAGVVGFFCHFWTWGLVVTFESTRPYFETGLAGLAVVAGIAVLGVVLIHDRDARP